MAGELTGRTALVTGAGRGIGRAVAVELAAHGALVIGASRTAADLAETEAAVAARGGRFIAAVTDLTVESQVNALFNRAELIDIVVNNAGGGQPTPLVDLTLEAWEQQMAVNARAVFLCTREAVRRLQGHGRGDIVNLSSLAGLKPQPGFSAYSASKAAAAAFTEAVAREVRRSGIRVTSLCPGAVATELRRNVAPNEDASAITQPEEIALLVRLIVSGRMRDLALEIF